MSTNIGPEVIVLLDCALCLCFTLPHVLISLLAHFFDTKPPPSSTPTTTTTAPSTPSPPSTSFTAGINVLTHRIIARFCKLICQLIHFRSTAVQCHDCPPNYQLFRGNKKQCEQGRYPIEVCMLWYFGVYGWSFSQSIQSEVINQLGKCVNLFEKLRSILWGWCQELQKKYNDGSKLFLCSNGYNTLWTSGNHFYLYIFWSSLKITLY